MLSLAFTISGCVKSDAEMRPVPATPTQTTPAPKGEDGKTDGTAPPKDETGGGAKNGAGAPTKKDRCETLPSLPADAREILADDLKALAGTLKLTHAQVLVELEFLREKATLRSIVSSKLSPLANLKDPDIRPSIDCKYFDEGPEGSIKGKIKAPIVIETATGNLRGSTSLEYTAYGARTGKTDELRQGFFAGFEYSSFNGLFTALRRNGHASIHLHADGVTLELRTRQDADNGEKRFKIEGRFVYVLPR